MIKTIYEILLQNKSRKSWFKLSLWLSLKPTIGNQAYLVCDSLDDRCHLLSFIRGFHALFANFISMDINCDVVFNPVKQIYYCKSLYSMSYSLYKGLYSLIRFNIIQSKLKSINSYFKVGWTILFVIFSWSHSQFSSYPLRFSFV